MTTQPPGAHSPDHPDFLWRNPDAPANNRNSYRLPVVDVINGRLTLFCVAGGLTILWSIVPRVDKFAPPGPRLTPAKPDTDVQALPTPSGAAIGIAAVTPLSLIDQVREIN